MEGYHFWIDFLSNMFDNEMIIQAELSHGMEIDLSYLYLQLYADVYLCLQCLNIFVPFQFIIYYIFCNVGLFYRISIYRLTVLSLLHIGRFLLINQILIISIFLHILQLIKKILCIKS